MRIPWLKLFLIVLGFLCVWNNSAFALPALQMDIDGGFYNPKAWLDDAETVPNPSYNPIYDPETIVANSNPFTLYALIDKTLASGNYYVSAALFREASDVLEDGATLGSILFNGEKINITSGMTWGTPPVAVTAKADDLQSHGIYPTYYKEFVFQFDTSKLAYTYNSQDYPGGLPDDGADKGLLYKDFVVDVSGLAQGYSIHFDFYNINPDGSVNKFAPFSHDAQSGDDRPPDTPGAVPEPATLILFGLGLMGLAGFQRKLTKR